MKRFLIVGVFVGLLAQSSLAQYGNQFQYNSFFKTTGSFEYPSELGTDIRTISVNLFGSSMYLGNSVADVNWLYNFANQSSTALSNNTNYLQGPNGEQYSIPHVLLDHMVNQTPETNYILGGGAVYPPLAIAFKIKTGEEKREIVTFSFNHKLKSAASYYFGKNLFRLLYNGNETFNGERVNLTDINLGVHAYREIGFGAAFPIIDVKGMGLRGGFNLKYLTGYGGVKTNNADVFFQSSEDGTSWTFEGDYRINAAYPDFDNTNVGSLLRQGIGTGVGIDVGASLQIWDNLKAYMSINDLGAVTYGSDHSTNLSSSGKVVFEGVRVNVFSTDEITVNYDTLLTKFNPKETNDGFNIALPTRLVLGGEFGINGKESKKGVEYFQHNLYFTYIQGFNRSPGNSVRPFINAGYGYRAGNVVSVGVNTGYGGIYGYNLGAFVALRGGPVRFAIGSNAFLSGFVPNLAKGFDFSMNLGIAI